MKIVSSKPSPEENRYRRQRAIDRIRMLPILALVLFFSPLFWSPSYQYGNDFPTVSLALSTGVIYIFGVWFLVIFLTLWAGRVSSRATVKDESTIAGDHEEQ